MHAEIISVGTELVSGQKLDTNSQWLSTQLGALGIATHFHTTLGDDLEENISAFRIAASRSDLVLVTGGIGPTQDDLTREALAGAAGVGLIEDAESLSQIRAFFTRRNREFTPKNRVQALRPESAQALPNPVGTAPGLWMNVGRAHFACMPGVPSEMKTMFAGEVVPRLRAMGFGGRVLAHRVINLFGRGEAEIESDALDLTARGRIPEVGITASDATISFRICAEGDSEAEAQASMEATAATIYQRYGDLIVGEATDDVHHALVKALRIADATIALAESCTGGMVAERLTRVPGASDVFLGGVVSYANSAKVALLGISPDLIEMHGAVSPEVAEAMAIGARDRFGSTIAVSVTGIAGPTGGTELKPVGLVYLGLAWRDGSSTKRLELGPEQPRDIIRSRAAKQAMNFARLHLIH